METSVTFLLDKSGSMGGIWDDTIGGFNSYIDALSGNIEFTLVQFDTSGLDKTHVRKPIKDVPHLDRKTYVPGGGTPLIEAAIKTIMAVEKSLKDHPADKVIFVIQTDGEENSSAAEYTNARLKALIEKKTEEGWQFNFIGTGVEAYGQAASVGISAAQTMASTRDPQHVRASFSAMGESTMRYASGFANTTGYLWSEKAAVGDANLDALDSLRPQKPAKGATASAGRKSMQFSLDEDASDFAL